MTTAFLLRFREECETAPEGPVCTGTQTRTYVKAEPADTDPRHYDFRSIPIGTSHSRSTPLEATATSALLSGTKTVTEVQKETADNDPTSRTFDTLPRANVQ